MSETIGWADAKPVIDELRQEVADLKEALAVAVEGLRKIDALDPKTDILADAWLITEGILSDPSIQRVLGQKDQAMREALAELREGDA